MKTFFHHIPVVIFALIVMISCKKDEERLVVATGEAPTLEASAETADLHIEQADNVGITFTWDSLEQRWSNPEQSRQLATYSIQIARQGNDFRSTTYSKTVDASGSAGMTIGELNQALTTIGYRSRDSAYVEIRLRVALSPNYVVYSNILNFVAVPYEPISYLYVPGAYQNWDPATAQSLISPTSNGIYEGIIMFPDLGSEFKITVERNWDSAYGDAGDSAMSLEADGNFGSPGAGSYQLTVNTNDGTIEFEPFSWGLIGDATPGGWSDDTPMTYDNETQIWNVQVQLTAGLFKFRKNSDWDVNLGGANGELTDGGADITIEEAGDYTITLNTNNNTYTLTRN